jgi:hypothetical protein
MRQGVRESWQDSEALFLNVGRPFNLTGLLGVWGGLYHKAAEIRTDSAGVDCFFAKKRILAGCGSGARIRAVSTMGLQAHEEPHACPVG